MAEGNRSVSKLFDQYVESLPTAQNAVDAVPGWTGALPPEAGADAGQLPLFADARIGWMLQHYGSLENRTVLELGPLEGGHTYMMEQAGAAKIDAIEANRLAFLRCLILKELVQLRRARFHLGNFVAWLDQPNLQYDLIVASGVLYHLRDPLHLLERAAAATDALFLWTHYVSDEAMPLGDPRRGMFRKTVERRAFRGIDVRLYPRSYQGAEAKVSFCGGIYDEHRWIQREDLLAALTALGFDSLQIAHEQTDHPNGPCFSLLARKSSR